MDGLLLKRIANHQMLHGSFCRDVGLMNGKMGVVLFFFHYSRHTGNVLYEDFAGELLDEVVEGLHADLPIRFSDGLCGIGWGIEYLIQNRFIEGDSDDVLKELDYKIVERDLRKIKDFSFDTGALGIACYVFSRLHSPNQPQEPFDRFYLNELDVALQKAFPVQNIDTHEVLLRMAFVEGSKDKELSWKHGLKMLAV